MRERCPFFSQDLCPTPLTHFPPKASKPVAEQTGPDAEEYRAWPNKLTQETL